MDYIIESGMSNEELIQIIKNYNENEVLIKTELSGNELVLKHGTSANSLKSILSDGLVGRKKSNINNFEHAKSSESLIYLTNKWHYMYAFISVRVAFEKYLKEKGLEFIYPDSSELLLDYWEETGNVPVVITVRVDESNLLIDEDIIYNKIFRNELRNLGSVNLNDVSYKQSLEQYTVACKEEIKIEQIEKIDIVAYSEMFDIIADSDYGNAFSTWCNGFLINYNPEDVYELMVDNNLGGIDELNLEDIKDGFNISYEKESCCVLINYNKYV